MKIAKLLWAGGRSVALVGSLLALEAGAADLDSLDPLRQAAVMTKSPERSYLIAITRAGSRLVAVGEAGRVILSDDNGRTWQQAKVPVGVTLTAVAFVDAQRGWAVGHSGVILASHDGGKTWQKQFDSSQTGAAGEPRAGSAPSVQLGGPGDPLLDVFFLNDKTGLAVGAFGRMLCTSDGGQQWLPCHSRMDNPEGNHLYGIHLVGDSIYIVGERGSIYASKDGGTSFARVSSPYEGSLFGVVGAGDRVAIFGLRGRVFVSSDRGQTWKDLSVGTEAGSVTGAVDLPGGRFALVAQDGSIFVTDKGAGRFGKSTGRNPPLSAVTRTTDGGLVGVGPRGVVLIKSATDLTEARS